MNMEITRAKVEVMKPVLLKAGIPLAISVAGFIFARLTTRKICVLKALNFEKTQVNRLTTCPHEEPRDEESFYSLDSVFSPSMEDEKQHILTGTHFDFDAEEENLGLKRRIQELQEGWWQLETRFFHYCKMKEQEKVLMELQNNMLLELARVEFLEREFYSLEANNLRFEALVVEYLKMLEQLGFARRENGLLHKKVKKLSRNQIGLFRVVREQNMEIEARKEETLRNHRDLETKGNDVKAFEDEIRKLQNVIHQLQQEKMEILHDKLEMAENSASSKIGAEEIQVDDYNKLGIELEKLQKDREAEVKELIFLRWSNACLRHELLRKNQEQQEQTQEKCSTDLELESGEIGELGHFGSENDLDCSGVTGGAQAHSKKPKLIQKIKRWVEGSEKADEREKRGGKCFQRS
ncbi:protein CHUP1, chloroplastic [Actinidia eriantha]|uniref:protein CHUP1, chloroplastic n=1 Tax=Actinidia eriantha TaxID=165200 RepID=UPI00258DF604|nr:protein CHUP1, chloroplastic [Actinidia eriantha]